MHNNILSVYKQGQAMKKYRIARHRFHQPTTNNEIMTVEYDTYTDEEMFMILMKNPKISYHTIDELGNRQHYIQGELVIASIDWRVPEDEV